MLLHYCQYLFDSTSVPSAYLKATFEKPVYAARYGRYESIRPCLSIWTWLVSSRGGVLHHPLKLLLSFVNSASSAEASTVVCQSFCSRPLKLRPIPPRYTLVLYRGLVRAWTEVLFQAWIGSPFQSWTGASVRTDFANLASKVHLLTLASNFFLVQGYKHTITTLPYRFMLSMLSSSLLLKTKTKNLI